MKQITIYDLLPLLRKGFVAMEPWGEWVWFKIRPCGTSQTGKWQMSSSNPDDLKRHTLTSDALNIVRFDGDWKDSLMECGGAVSKNI